MKFFLFALSVIIIIFFGSWILVSTIKKTPTAEIDNHTFNLYVAKSDKDKQIGLSKYKNIDNTKGMVFSFSKPNYYPFWMKEMKFPIDIIYIKDGKIVTIYKNVPTPTNDSSLPIYNSKAPADRVLEVNAGLSQKYNFKEGDRVAFSNI